MSIDPRQVASADDLWRRYGSDATVFARALAGHPDEDTREFWAGVLRLLAARDGAAAMAVAAG